MYYGVAMFSNSSRLRLSTDSQMSAQSGAFEQCLAYGC